MRCLYLRVGISGGCCAHTENTAFSARLFHARERGGKRLGIWEKNTINVQVAGESERSRNGSRGFGLNHKEEKHDPNGRAFGRGQEEFRLI